MNDSSYRVQPGTASRRSNGKLVCLLSWVPQLAETRRWLLSTSGYTVISLIGADGIRQLDGIDAPDLLVLGHSVPIEQKQRAIKLFRGRCGSPVLSLLAPHTIKLKEAEYGVEAHNPHEFMAIVKEILASPTI